MENCLLNVNWLSVYRQEGRRFAKHYEVWNCLGLIETRRGEGTFLVDFKKHQLVEVLAAFIMQQPDSVVDVQETRRIHETAAIRTVCNDTTLRSLPVWEKFAYEN